MTGTFEFEKGDERPAPDFNVFFRDHATYPYYSDAVWYLTQMRRWGQIAEAQARRLVRRDREVGLQARDLPEQAARLLVDEGLAERGGLPLGQRRLQARRPPTFIDGIEYDGRDAERLSREASRSG